MSLKAVDPSLYDDFRYLCLCDFGSVFFSPLHVIRFLHHFDRVSHPLCHFVILLQGTLLGAVQGQGMHVGGDVAAWKIYEKLNTRNTS